MDPRLRLTLEAAEIEQAISELQVYRNALEKVVMTGTDAQCEALVRGLDESDGPKHFDSSQN